MTNVTVNLEAMSFLAKEMTAAATATANALGNLDQVIDQRVQAAVAEELGRISAGHKDEVDELTRKLRSAEQRREDVLAEMRRQFAALERNYQRAAAALRASGDPEFRWGKRPDAVAGEPPASAPGEQILHWLGELLPEAPDGRYVFLLGDMMVTANPEGDLRGNETEMHPDGRSRVVPISALAQALAVVAQEPAGTTVGDLRMKVRNVLLGHGVPNLGVKRGEDVPQPPQ